MNEFYETEGYEVDELVANTVNALNDDGLVRSFVELIFYLDKEIR